MSAASAIAANAVRVLLVLAALAASGSLAAQTRVGYVDMQRLLDNAPQIATGNERLRSEFAERDRLLKADEARLEELRQRRSSPGGDADALATLDAQIDAQERRVRRIRESLREELRRRGEDELEQRWREINEAVAAFARDENYDLIVSSPVFYASPSIDITDRVLARLRAAERAGAAPPAADGSD